MELCDIYCGFGRNERNKCGVCLNENTWLKICGKEKWNVQKTKWKKSEKMVLNKKKRKKREKNDEKKKVEVQFEFYYVKLVELMLFEK